MRLDSYLVETGIFSSRGRAKKAISNGEVKVDGAVVTKTSKDVSTGNSIEVTEGLDKPEGYFKLQSIQEKTGILEAEDLVLDLGSSAGGFIMYASGIAGHITGVEFSKHFRSELGKLAYENENVDVIFGDVFSIPLEELSETPVDVILSDMTLEPADSLEALERVLPLLKEGGKLLQVLKIDRARTHKGWLKKMEAMGLSIVDVIEPQKREIYIFARKE
ncbi:23S rRNA (cytidine1920-2'-O)/16S rRNA (cytidine1409-2'-O)-methyltransferase [Methanohalophilus levihalophilus]|uniref:SAM-dependent methyltransferase n=1 Tax=Methanohalophilus levihalophilus TaxID=1431282 RepID=UPI001AE11FF5|nr:SAM-dependent methyltransferase [Methanohalophilus levihalophilus]MBP2029161.1 23S rRNA (cytidine1920-2'-O)/16S rRNA (cytidine1409-2'-O)-methyltransferase [Methanohalophilus levihalophilus]